MSQCRTMVGQFRPLPDCLLIQKVECACANPVVVGSYALCIRDNCQGSQHAYKQGAAICNRSKSHIASYQATLATAEATVGPAPANETDVVTVSG